MIDGLVDGSMGMMSVNFWTDVAIYLLLPNFCLSPSSLLLRRRILNQFCKIMSSCLSRRGIREVALHNTVVEHTVVKPMK